MCFAKNINITKAHLLKLKKEHFSAIIFITHALRPDLEHDISQTIYTQEIIQNTQQA